MRRLQDSGRWVGLVCCGWLSCLIACDGSPSHAAPVDAAAVGEPVVWYRFEEDLTADSSGWGRQGRCRGECPRTGKGRIGTAAEFDGTNMILLSDDGSLTTPDGWTAAAWMRLDAPDRRVGVFTKTFRSGPSNSWALAVDRHGRPFCFSSTDDDSDELFADLEVKLGRWYHLACSWDGTTKRFYVDGEQVGSVRTGSEFDSGPVVVGGDVDGTPKFFMVGRVDEAIAFNYALAPGEIANLADPGAF